MMKDDFQQIQGGQQIIFGRMKGIPKNKDSSRLFCLERLSNPISNLLASLNLLEKS